MPIYAPLPPRVRLICKTCQRRGAYGRARFVEMTGTENSVTALEAFARHVAKCPRALDSDPRIDERCGLVYDLSPD